MTQTDPMRLAVCIVLLLWGVSASSNWDYRFFGNVSSDKRENSSRISNTTSSSSKRLYSEGGEIILQDMESGKSAQINDDKNHQAMNISRMSYVQSARNITMFSEGGGSDTVQLEDKGTRFGDATPNSTTYGGDVNSSRDEGRSLSNVQLNDNTALAVVGRSLEDHHSEPTGPRSDAVSSYYDFLVNEGSYKFWSVFQVFTAALLIYSAFAAVYYAKYTFATMDYPDYMDDGFFFRRSGDRAQGEDMYYDDDDYGSVTTPRPQQSTFLGMSSATFQRIMDALSSKKYS